jgi:anti-sigma factor RsiW
VTDWDSVDFGEITCREFVELVTEYLEDRVDAATRVRFEQHVAGCPGCAEYLAQIRAAQAVLGRTTLDPISDRARDQLMTAFRAWRAARPGDPPGSA